MDLIYTLNLIDAFIQGLYKPVLIILINMSPIVNLGDPCELQEGTRFPCSPHAAHRSSGPRPVKPCSDHH